MQSAIATETWVKATWQEYLDLIEDPNYEKARCYYHNGKFRIEMSPIGYDHSQDNTILCVAVNLYGITRAIPMKGLTGCSFRKQGVRECQPDLAYYLGDNARVIPHGTKIVSLDIHPPPNLAIELGDSSWRDDLSTKRKLYIDLDIEEYWVVDVKRSRIIAFTILNGESEEIRESRVLAGLTMNILEETLRRSRASNQTEAGRWLFTQFSE